MAVVTKDIMVKRFKEKRVRQIQKMKRRFIRRFFVIIKLDYEIRKILWSYSFLL